MLLFHHLAVIHPNSSRPDEPVWNWRVALALLPGLLLVGYYVFDVFRTIGTLGFPLDDSWIHAQFARNLATGRGFSYTDSHAIAGSTAPGWTLLLAGGYFLSRNMVVAAVILGVILQLLAGFYATRLAEHLGAPRLIRWTAGTLVVVTPVIVWGAVSGMEVPLAAAMALAGLDYHFRARKFADSRRYLGIALLGASTLARPENLALVAVVLGCECLGREPIRARFIRLATGALVALLTIAPSVAFSYATIGRPLPTTYYAKRGPGLGRAIEARDTAMAKRTLLTFGPRAVQGMSDILIAQYSWAAGLVVLGLATGIASASSRRPALTLLAILVLVPYAMGATAPQRLKPDNVRYAAQLVVLAAPLIAVGTWQALRQRAVAAAILWVAAGVVGWGALEGSTAYRQSVKNIQELHVATGRWIAEHLPHEAVIAANDVGAIAYFSDRRILDLEGLVSPQVLAYRTLPDRGLRVVMEMKPDYVAIFPGWYPEISRSPAFREIHRVSIADNYVAAGDTIIVYTTPWTEHR